MTLVGPFWTRGQVAGYLGVPPDEVRRRRALLCINGVLSAEEAYPSFQFGGGTVRHEVAFLSPLLKRRVSDLEACDWLTRPQRVIDNRTPIDWLGSDGDVDRVVRALPTPSRPIPGRPLGADTKGPGTQPEGAVSPGLAGWSPRPITD